MNNTTYFYYEGAVDINLKIKGKTYTIAKLNNGEPFLKYSFIKLLAGDIDDLCDDCTKKEPIGYFTPATLEIWKATKSGDIYLEEQSFTTQGVPVEASYLDGEDNIYTSVQFTAYVPFDYLQEEVDPVAEKDAGNKYYLYLFSNDDATLKLNEKNHKIARLEITPRELSYITPGTTATITWVMKLIPAGTLIDRTIIEDPYIKYTFAKLVRGKFNDLGNKDIPKFLTIQKITNFGTDEQEIVNFYKNPVRLTSNLVDIVDGLYTGVCFSAQISYDQLLDIVNPQDETSKYSLCLITDTDTTKRLGETQHVIARLLISPLALSYLSPAVVATVTWTIKLLNKDEVV